MHYKVNTKNLQDKVSRIRWTINDLVEGHREVECRYYYRSSGITYPSRLCKWKLYGESNQLWILVF